MGGTHKGRGLELTEDARRAGSCPGAGAGQQHVTGAPRHAAPNRVSPRPQVGSVCVDMYKMKGCEAFNALCKARAPLRLQLCV